MACYITLSAMFEFRVPYLQWYLVLGLIGLVGLADGMVSVRSYCGVELC